MVIKWSFWTDLGVVGGDGGDVKLTVHAVTGFPVTLNKGSEVKL